MSRCRCREKATVQPYLNDACHDTCLKLDRTTSRTIEPCSREVIRAGETRIDAVIAKSGVHDDQVDFALSLRFFTRNPYTLGIIMLFYSHDDVEAVA